MSAHLALLYLVGRGRTLLEESIRDPARETLPRPYAVGQLKESGHAVVDLVPVKSGLNKNVQLINSPLFSFWFFSVTSDPPWQPMFFAALPVLVNLREERLAGLDFSLLVAEVPAQVEL